MQLLAGYILDNKVTVYGKCKKKQEKYRINKHFSLCR